MKTRAVIQALGHGLPKKVVSNDDLAKFLDTSDEWITQRTGIRERRVVSDGETTASLSIVAAREAMDRADVSPREIDLVMCATVSGEFIWPATACTVQEALGIRDAGAYDLSAACAGFIYALDQAAALLETGRAKKILLIGADTLTRQLDWNDRSTCVLFGDGAAAAVVSAETEAGDRGLLSTVLFSDGSGAHHIAVEVGGSRYPYGRPESFGHSTCITMNGKEVYRFAINAMGDACSRLLCKAGFSAEDVDLFVPHQANLRIIESAAKRLELPDEKVFVNVEKYGNTSGASVPLALYEAEQAGRLKKGMVVMTVGFGAGLVWGANLIRW